jgi:hypothetical protein
MRRYSLIEDEQENYGFGNGYEPLEERETLPDAEDEKSMLRVLLREAETAANQTTLDELKARITAILPGANFEVDDLGQIVIRTGFRVNIDSEALAEVLRRKARDQFPPKRGRSRRKK